ncbi:MAG: lytic transglycosylase domain-containing protein [Dermatophilaceae bacterium]
MSNSDPRTFTVPWRRICAAIPSVALIGGGIALSSPPLTNISGVGVSSSSPAVVVPDVALSMPAPAGAPSGATLLDAEVAPVPSLAGSAPSSSFVSPDSSAIPVRALEGYRRAASLVDSADRACHIDWALVAAIGRVESNHGRFGGNQLDSAGVAQPGIIGIALDGSNGTARITDSDGGLLDGDTVYDRAVGPMQFIPSTWSVAGVDADGDGVRNPQDIADAATATAVYLCSGPGDLALPNDLHSAIMRYNASESYVALVTSIAATYRLGVSALPASDGPMTSSPAPVSTFTVPTPEANVLSVKPVPGMASPTTANGAGVLAPGAPTSIGPTTSAPPDLSATTPPDPTTTVPPLPDPTTTVPPLPDPTTTVPPLPDPTTTVPPLPDPCVTISDPPPTPDPAVTAPVNLCPTPSATIAP